MSNSCCTPSDYLTDNKFTWCTNCGNYGIHGALRNSLAKLNITPKDALLCFDVGCNGNGSDKIDGYRFHGLHGRVIPFAAGASLANQRLTVVASAGDGATLGEGINHLIHAVRANYNMTFILHNNHNYGLTTGQASPSTPEGIEMTANPFGVTSTPINPSKLVLALEPSFVARGYSGNVRHLEGIIEAGINHKGFSFIEILQDCPTYNGFKSHDWYLERVYNVQSLSNYNLESLELANAVISDTETKIATGIIYKKDAPDFMEKQQNREGMSSELVDEVKPYENIEDLFAVYL